MELLLLPERGQPESETIITLSHNRLCVICVRDLDVQIAVHLAVQLVLQANGSPKRRTQINYFVVGGGAAAAPESQSTNYQTNREDINPNMSSSKALD